MSLQYLVQPFHGPYSDLFKFALGQGEFTSIHAAVAYATIGGVRVLANILAESMLERWNLMNKSWLVGIDWCRSDPPALMQLTKLNDSSVRVPDGARIIATPGCSPTVTFHPKLFLLNGPEIAAVISGSGNLSANGMLRGCECGSLFLQKNDPRETENSPVQHVTLLRRWFDEAWSHATNYKDISVAYEKACVQRAREKVLMPTDDDSVAVQRRALNAIQLQQLRTFDHMWIESGDVGSNLGRGKPGNQLDMKRFSRVFFGATAEDLAIETEIAKLTLVWDGVSYPEETLKYGQGLSHSGPNAALAS